MYLYIDTYIHLNKIPLYLYACVLFKMSDFIVLILVTYTQAPSSFFKEECFAHSLLYYY